MNVIHFVLGKANPNRMNGVNKVVNNLATYQQNIVEKVSVWGITPTPEDVSDIPERPYETILFKAKNRWQIDPAIQKRIKTIPKNSVFHLHGGLIPDFYHFHKILVENKIPYIITPHGCYNEKAMEKKAKMKEVYFKYFERPFLEKSKYLHCIGKSELEASKKLVPDVDKILIPNGQSLKALKFDHEDIGEHDDQIPVFGFCGRMDTRMKGLDLLLKGFKYYLKEMQKPGKLWMIGGGQNIQELKKLANELDIYNDVLFWGPQYGNAKLNIISKMDAFYHASRYEGMPTAILEAAALKVPCAVSDATNLAEYVRKYNAGYILEPNTLEEIAWSMVSFKSLKNNNKINDLGENALQMVKTEFDWKRIAQNFVEAYAA